MSVWSCVTWCSSSSPNMYARLSPTWTTHSCVSSWNAIVTVVPMPLNSGCSVDFLEDAGVGLAERRLELREDSLRVGSVRVERTT